MMPKGLEFNIALGSPGDLTCRTAAIYSFITSGFVVAWECTARTWYNEGVQLLGACPAQCLGAEGPILYLQYSQFPAK